MKDSLMNYNGDIFENYRHSESILSDMQGIIETAQRQAYRAANMVLTLRNWLIGKRIFEETLHGGERADYGTGIIKKLSAELTEAYGKGYDQSNLYHYLNFYKTYPEIVDTASRQSGISLALQQEQEEE